MASKGNICSNLKVKDVDFCIKENGLEHNTTRYELMNRGDNQARLVIRRGQAFYLDISLSRNYDPVIDDLSIVFTLDGVKKPIHGFNAVVTSPALDPKGLAEDEWKSVVVAYSENSLKLKITPSAKSIIGKWSMEIDTKQRDSESVVSFAVDYPFYLICNPWCREDVVFLENEEERQEYVLADTGLIWRGESNRMQASVWKYAQFEKDILDCAMYLITEIGKVRLAGRNDPVVITRCLSAAVNSPDDNGVLAGNWSDDYSGGTPPTQWIGSQKILQQYYKTKKPVKYGQCWVYAGVLTTVCRSLGIPCRTVTNFASAHDTRDRNAHYSLTIDYYVDEKGNTMEELSRDMIWNFHVWNEVWMKRLDLTEDHHGWQVIDATPQEHSGVEGYRCGPASVAAIKRGEVHQSYDINFIFAEVNADIAYWRYDGPKKPPKLVRKDTVGVGQNISTKAVGRWEREDLTHNYKFPEYSKAERDAMMAALRRCESSLSRYYLDESFNDIKFDFELRDDIIVGQPFKVVLVMKNQSNVQTYQVSVILHVEAVAYTGRKSNSIKSFDSDCSIQPGATEKVVLEVSWEDYNSKLLDQGALNVSCLASVKDTNFEYYAKDNFRLRKPDIVIKLDSSPVVGEQLKATARFTNPLPVPLKSGEFTIDGPGLEEHLKFQLSEDVKVGGEVVQQFFMTPKFTGSATIAAKFHSKQLDDVDGLSDFVVSGDTQTIYV